MIDHVVFKNPQSFGTTLITLGTWQRQPDGNLMIYDLDGTLGVKIETGGKAFDINVERIREDAPVIPTRISINLKKPVLEATITQVIKTIDMAGKASGGL